MSGKNVRYVGAFALPPGAQGDGYYEDFGFGLSFFRDSSGRRTLFTEAGRNHSGRLGQFEIPEDADLIQTTSPSFSVFQKHARVLQPFAEATNSTLDSIDSDGNTKHLYGTLVAGGKLLMGAANYYSTMVPSGNIAFRSSPDISSSSFSGWKRLSGPGLVSNVRSQGGMMAAIPAAWRQALGGDVLVGNGTGPLSVVGNSSWGFSINVLDSSTLSSAPTIPAYTAVFFDSQARTMAAYVGSNDSKKNPVWNLSSWIGGYFIPEGSRSLGVVYAHGAGEFCYGFGYASGPIDASNTLYCDDAWNREIKGPHAQVKGFGYQLQIAFYDLNDLVAVRSGSKKPSELVPTSIHVLPDSRASNPSGQINGMPFAEWGYLRSIAYEPDFATGKGRLYISPGGTSGRIEVFEVSVP